MFTRFRILLWLCFSSCVVLRFTAFAHDLPRTNPAALYTTLPDSYVLSELPLSALLKVRKSVSNIICSDYFRKDEFNSCPALISDQHQHPHDSPTNETKASEPPSARTLSEFLSGGGGEYQYPVSNELQDHRKTYYDHGGGGHGGGGVWKGYDESSGKLQKLFQFSITALAFLAFGGYLLCMIVQAIKSKGTVYYNPYLPGSSAIKKKKPIFSYGRRRRRSLRFDGPAGAPSTTTTTTNDRDLDMMYNGLISALGAYVKLYAPV